MEKTMKSETLFDQKERSFYLISLSLPFKLNLELLVKCFSCLTRVENEGETFHFLFFINYRLSPFVLVVQCVDS